MIAFLARRSIAGVEQVADGEYRRTVAARTPDGAVHRGWLVVRPCADADALQVRLSDSLWPAADAVLARVRRVFDLDCEPDAVIEALGEWARPRRGLRLPGTFDGFEVAVRAVLGQQITVRAAHTIAGRVARAFGEPVGTPFEGLDVVFPAAQRMAGLPYERIAELGINAARARSILALAQAIDSGELRLAPGVPADEVVPRLLALPGVGDWTAQYLAMRGLSFADAFPAADYGVMKALGVRTAREALARAERWRPWRAYAVIHLWASLA